MASRPLSTGGVTIVLPEIDDDTDHVEEVEERFDGQTFILEYRDARGRVSLRRVTARSISYGSGGVPSLIAYCHERQALRQFRSDRIGSCSDFDGVVYTNSAKFLLDNFGLSLVGAEDPIGDKSWADVLEAVRPDAVILACVSRSDGSRSSMEAEVIQQHIGWVAERSQGMLSDEELRSLERYVMRLRPTQSAINRAIEALRLKRSSEIQRLFKACLDVMDSDNIRHEGEKEVIEALSLDLLGFSVLV